MAVNRLREGTLSYPCLPSYLLSKGGLTAAGSGHTPLQECCRLRDGQGLVLPPHPPSDNQGRLAETGSTLTTSHQP